MKPLEWVRQKTLRLLRGVPEERGILDGFTGGYSAANLTGISITEKSALTLTSAYACINVLSTDLSWIPLRVLRARPGGGSEVRNDVAAAELLQLNPDGKGETTPSRFRQALWGHRFGWGNGYAVITRAGNGDPIGLELLDPETEPARRQRDDRLYYRLPSGGTYRPDQVIHFAGLGFDGLKGYSPVRLFRQAIALGLAAETFGASLFGNGSTPRGYLTHPTKLSPQARENLRESFEGQYRGVYNANRLAILEEGVEWKQLTINPEDAQFLATRQFQVIEICRIYRVPPNKVADLSQAHLANIEASNLDYMTTVLAPLAEEAEQVLNLRLLSDRERRAGYFIAHDFRAFLRGDMKSRAEFYGRGLNDGWINRDEVREWEGLNPIIGSGGDAHTVNGNLKTLASLASGDSTPTDHTPAGGNANVSP